MADNHSRNSRLHNPPAEPSYDVYDEDPLVELARIVSEDGGYFNIADRQQARPPVEPEPELHMEAETNDAELGVDLETQLLEELELSMGDPQAADYGEEDYQPTGHYRDDTYFEPGAESSAGYETGHAYAPEEAATLARMSEPPTAVSAEFADDTWDDAIEAAETAAAHADPLAEAADHWAEQTVPMQAETSGYEVEPADVGFGAAGAVPPGSDAGAILSADELAELNDNVTGQDNYFAEADVDLDSEFSGAIAEAGTDDDHDDMIGIPPVVPLGDKFAASGRDVKPEGRSGRKLFAIAAVLSIAVLGGGVVAMMSSTSMTTPGGTPPVIKADTSPVKMEPEVGEDTASDTTQRAFDVASDTGKPVEEVLRDRTETPVDRVIPLEETQRTDVLKPVGSDPTSAGGEKSMARISDGDTARPSSAPKFDPIGPKTVTTMKVNADGTIIRPSLDENPAAPENADDSIIVGGLPSAVPAETDGSVLSAEPKPVPVDVVEIKTEPEASDAAETSGETTPLASVIAGLPEAAGDAPAMPLPRARPEEAPALTARATPSAETTLVAQPAQPSNPVQSAQGGSAPVNLLEAARQSAPRQAAAPEASPVNTGSTASGSGYLVQLSSQRSEEQAIAAFDGLKQRFPSLLGNHNPNIQRADLGDRGVYYRVRVGPMADQTVATQFCEQLKSSGGSCFVTR
jgi:hypothetical protein